jgi:transposase-like protein
MTAVARELAIPPSTLARWVKQSDAGDGQFNRRVSAELQTSVLSAVRAQTAAFNRMSELEVLRRASLAELASLIRATQAFVLGIAPFLTSSQGEGSALASELVEGWRGGREDKDDEA